MVNSISFLQARDFVGDLVLILSSDMICCGRCLSRPDSVSNHGFMGKMRLCVKIYSSVIVAFRKILMRLSGSISSHSSVDRKCCRSSNIRGRRVHE